MVRSAKVNKKALSYVQAMRKTNITTATPITKVSTTVFSDRRKLIEAMNIIRKTKTTTTITPTNTTIPVVNSAPVVSGGGGSSSSSTSATPVATPIISTTSVPVVTTIVPVAQTAPAPVAPVVVAPTAPAPVVTPTGTTPINIVSPQNPNLAKLAEYQKVM